MRERGGFGRLAATEVAGFTTIEWLPTALLVPYSLLNLATTPEPLFGPPAVLALSALAACTALLWRRRHPLTVIAVVWAAVLVPAAVWGSSHLNAGVFAVMVAVFAVGAYAPTVRGVAALVGSIAGTLVFLELDPADSAAASWPWALNLVWLFGAGVWVRQQRTAARQSAQQERLAAEAESANERLRLARDLHDLLGHNLAVMVLQAEGAEALLAADPNRAREALHRVQETGRSALTDVRAFVDALRDGDDTSGVSTAAAEEVGAQAIPAIVDRVRAAGMPVTCEVVGDLSAIEPTTADAAVRLVQEALTNTVSHAGRVQTSVLVVVAEESVLVSVCDDGQRVEDRHGRAGRGLQGMRERIEAVGGWLDVGPVPQGGFRVSATLPRSVEGPA